MHGLSSISASWSRSKLKTKNTKPVGDHSHINNDTHRLPHIWPYIFTPYISSKSLFLPKIVTQSPIFVTLSRILEIFHSKTPNELEFEKKLPKCRLFFYGFCHWKTPYFFTLHTHVCLRGMLLPQTRSEAGKFCILETESRAIWWILSGVNLIKVMKIKFQFYRLNRPNCALYGWISLEGRDDIQAIIHLVKHGRGYILQTPSINLHPWLSKQMPSISEDVRVEAF